MINAKELREKQEQIKDGVIAKEIKKFEDLLIESIENSPDNYIIVKKIPHYVEEELKKGEYKIDYTAKKSENGKVYVDGYIIAW